MKYGKLACGVLLAALATGCQSTQESQDATRRANGMRAETDERPADFPHGLSSDSGSLRDDRYRESTDAGSRDYR